MTLLFRSYKCEAAYKCYNAQHKKWPLFSVLPRCFGLFWCHKAFLFGWRKKEGGGGGGGGGATVLAIFFLSCHVARPLPKYIWMHIEQKQTLWQFDFG